MREFIISDTHFGEDSIRKGWKRPFRSAEEMDRALIDNWNEVVGENDIVYHLGDFGTTHNPLRDYNLIRHILSQLNGKIILVTGNHEEYRPTFYLKCGFLSVSEKRLDISKQLVLMHRPRGANSPDCQYYFGHTHTNRCGKDIFPNWHCVCVERIGYRPLPFPFSVREN